MRRRAARCSWEPNKFLRTLYVVSGKIFLIFPSSFKQAIVHPLLKKPSLPDDDLNNFRPISNLNFISKILEKVVASRIQSHLLSNSLSSSFQSAYRQWRSEGPAGPATAGGPAGPKGARQEEVVSVTLQLGAQTSCLRGGPKIVATHCLSHVPFHWNHTSRYSQWPHLSDGSWWGHFSHSSWFICCLRYCRSFHPSSSSSTLVWSSWYFSWLVLILSHLTFSSSLHPKFHFIFLKSFLWCTSRFRPWPTSFHSLYNSSWLCHLKELNQIPPLCWWHPAVHFFHSFKFKFFTWNALQYFLWHTLLDEL